MFEEKLAVLLVIAGFYLADCIVFLAPTQALGTIRLHRRPRWRFGRRAKPFARKARPDQAVALSFGLTFYPTMGYFPAILNPFVPWVAAFKTSPLVPRAGKVSEARALPLHRLIGARLTLRPMGFLLAAHAGLILVAIPYMLFMGRLDTLLSLLALDFLLAIAIIAISYPLVRILRLRRAQYWSLAIQSLICLPLSLNFPRKLALLAPAKADAGALLCRVPSDTRQPVAQDFIAVIEYTQSIATDAAQSARLGDLLSHLRKEVPVD